MSTRVLSGAISAGALIAGLSFQPAVAGGFHVQEQSARAVGRAFSGEAADSGPASLWWNPAAIGFGTGRGEAYLGVHRVIVDADVEDTGSTIRRPVPGLPPMPVGGASLQKNPIDKGLIPNLGAAWRLNDRWAVGLTVNAPFNFTTRYGLDSFTRYQALKSRLFNIDIQPTLAWTPTPQLALGLGVDITYADATLSNALPNPSPLAPDGASNLTGNGWDYGWTAGLQWKPVEPVTLGLSYRSGVKHRLDGRVTVAGLLGPAAAANLDAPGEATFETPSILTASGRWRATDRLTLNAQVQRFDWSAFDAIRVTFAGRTQVSPQDYEDTTSIAVGADYALSPQWTLRAGVQRDPTPTPDIGRTTRVPDGDRWLYAAGFSFNPSERMAVDVGAAYIHFADSEVDSDASAFAGTPLATPIAMHGLVKGHGLVLSAGVRMGF